MKSLVNLIALFTATGIAAAAAAGNDGSLVGNGGVTIACHQTPGAAFVGYFTLDYLLDYRTEGPLAQLAPVASWEQSRRRLQVQLQRLSPVLAQSFADFSSQILQQREVRGRVWTPFDLTRIDSGDQEINRNLPPNCYVPKAGGLAPDVRQTALRRYLTSTVQYLYQKDILETQLTRQPLQFSFFMVHEWLWDFTESVQSLRDVNWLLHSTSLESLTPEGLNGLFQRMGFFNRSLPVCHRSVHVRGAIERALQRRCDQITDPQLAGIVELSLPALGVNPGFRSGDFSRLYNLKRLDLSMNPGVVAILPPYAFTDLLNLEELNLRDSFTGKLPEHLREGPRLVRVRN